MLASKSQSSEVRIDLVPQAATLCPNEKLVLLVKVLHDANGTHRRFKTLLDIILESRVWDYYYYFYLKVDPDRVARLSYLDGLHHPSVTQLPQHQIIIKLTWTLNKVAGGGGGHNTAIIHFQIRNYTFPLHICT